MFSVMIKNGLGILKIEHTFSNTTGINDFGRGENEGKRRLSEN